MIVGLTIDPVTAAAVAAQQTRVIEWPAAWTDALRAHGVGLPSPESRPIAGLSVIIHGGLGWSSDHQRRASQLGVDDRACGRVIARATIDRLQGDRAQLREVEPVAPVVATGNGLEPWIPSWPLRRRVGLGLGEPAARAASIESPPQPDTAERSSASTEPGSSATSSSLMRRARAAAKRPPDGLLRSAGTATPTPAGVSRIWCSLCWRLVGVDLAKRALVLRGTRLAVARRSSRCGVGAIACSDCADAVAVETTHTWATEIAAGMSATEDVTRATLDRALAGPIAEMLANGSAGGVVPVIGAGLEPWIECSQRPPLELLGNVVAIERGGRVVGVARLAGYTTSRLNLHGRSQSTPDLHGQRPAWWCPRAAPALHSRWLLDDVHHVEPFVWTGRQLAGDPLLLVVERLRERGARLVPWVRWPDPGRPLLGWQPHCPSTLLPAVAAEDGLPTCAVAAAGLLGPEAAWGRWRLTDGELVGRGLRMVAPPARVAWASLQREVRRREQFAPAPYPLGYAPPGRYWILRPDGPAFIDHPGGEAEGVVWLARVRQPATTAGAAREQESA